MAKKVPALNLPPADELFTTQEERDDLKREKVQEISLTEIDPFPNHPFRVNQDETMQVMADSVKVYGIQTPAIVRLKEDGRYEMISGHRRKLACELAGLDAMPCIVRDLSNDEAVIAVVDSNLQREVILPSEKAWSYKMKLDAMKRQGQRTDLTCAPVGHKSTGQKSRDVLAQESSDSREQVRRYIRLTELSPQLLDMVDDNRLTMRPAVELSYLSQEHQQALLSVMESEDCTPSHVQAMKLRKFSVEGNLSNDVILSVMREDKPAKAEQFKFPRERINRFFPTDTPATEIEETIIKALELWWDKNKT